MKVVFLHGKSGSGKDTSFDYICSKFNYKPYRLSAVLKTIISVISCEDVKHCYNNKKMIPKDMGSINWTLGEYHQKLGEAIRKVHTDIFILSLWKTIKKSGDKCILITDVRHKNEYHFFKKAGAVSIRLTRPFDMRMKYLCGRDPYDISEVDLDDEKFDYEIDNYYETKNMLYSEIDKVFEKIHKK